MAPLRVRLTRFLACLALISAVNTQQTSHHHHRLRVSFGSTTATTEGGVTVITGNVSLADDSAAAIDHTLSSPRTGFSVWLPFATSVQCRYNGASLSLAYGSLALINTTRDEGEDVFGSFTRTTLLMADLTHQPLFAIGVRVYDESNLAVAFSQTRREFTGCNASDAEPPAIGFPAFSVGKGSPTEAKGYAYWHGLWPQPVVGEGLSRDSPRHLPERHDGPVTFSSGVGETGQRLTVVLAPLNEPANTVFSVDGSLPGAAPQDVLAFGPAQTLAFIPEGYLTETLIVAGEGMTLAMEALRTALRQFHGGITRRLVDPFVQNLTFWTDNGAYEFWNDAGALCNCYRRLE